SWKPIRLAGLCLTAAARRIGFHESGHKEVFHEPAVPPGRLFHRCVARSRMTSSMVKKPLSSAKPRGSTPRRAPRPAKVRTDTPGEKPFSPSPQPPGNGIDRAPERRPTAGTEESHPHGKER